MALSQAFYTDWFQELRGLEAHNKAKQRTKARCVQIAIPLRSILWQFGLHLLCPCWRRYV